MFFGMNRDCLPGGASKGRPGRPREECRSMVSTEKIGSNTAFRFAGFSHYWFWLSFFSSLMRDTKIGGSLR